MPTQTPATYVFLVCHEFKVLLCLDFPPLCLHLRRASAACQHSSSCRFRWVLALLQLHAVVLEYMLVSGMVSNDHDNSLVCYAHPVLGICDLLLDILQVLIHDSDPACILFQFKVHLLQLLLQGLQENSAYVHE